MVTVPDVFGVPVDKVAVDPKFQEVGVADKCSVGDHREGASRRDCESIAGSAPERACLDNGHGDRRGLFG